MKKLIPIKNIARVRIRTGPSTLRTAIDRIAVKAKGETEFREIYRIERLEYPRWSIPDYLTMIEDTDDGE